MATYWVVKHRNLYYCQSSVSPNCYVHDRAQAERFSDAVGALAWAKEWGGRPVKVTERASLLDELRYLLSAQNERSYGDFTSELSHLIARHERSRK